MDINLYMRCQHYVVAMRLQQSRAQLMETPDGGSETACRVFLADVRPQRSGDQGPRSSGKQAEVSDKSLYAPWGSNEYVPALQPKFIQHYEADFVIRREALFQGFSAAIIFR
jgi:hypothetical protein